MKKQVWLQPYEWTYIAKVLMQACDGEPTVYSKNCVRIGQEECKRLAARCFDAAKDRDKP